MRSHISALTALFKAISPKSRRGLFASVLATAATVLSSSSLMACSAYIISFSALQPSIADIMVPVTAVRFFGISRALLRYGERLVAHSTVFSYLSRLRVWLYEGVSRLSGEQLLRLNRSEAFNALTGDIESLQDFFLRSLLPLLSTLLLGLLAEGVLLVLSPGLAGIFAIFYPLATLGMAFAAWRLTHGASEAWTRQASDYKTAYSRYADAIFELRWNRREPDYRQALTSQTEVLEKSAERAALGKIIAVGGQQLLINLSVLSALIYGIYLTSSGLMPGVLLAVMTLVMFSLYEAAPAFLTLFQKLEAAAFSARRMVNVCQGGKDAATTWQSSGDPQPFAKQEASYPTIHYENIGFSYSPDGLGFDKLSLSLKPGRHIAIVGASGSGKSTLSALLCGLLSPQEGRIALETSHRSAAANSVSERLEMPLAESEGLMRYFSVINQEVYLFHKRLHDNLLLGHFNASAEEMASALTTAGLSDWLGTAWFESNPWVGQNGMSLSGGQRQRVALARALLRPAPYLLLDEAFAGLDTATEGQILGNLLNLQDRSLIWITHRLIQLDRMDCIYVLDGGRLIDSGTHEELLKRCERYARMVEVQAGFIGQ